MSYRRRLSDQLIASFQNSCDAHNEMLAAVIREAANIELRACCGPILWTGVRTAPHSVAP